MNNILKSYCIFNLRQYLHLALALALSLSLSFSLFLSLFLSVCLSDYQFDKYWVE